MTISRLKKLFGLPLAATVFFAIIFYFVVPAFAPVAFTDEQLRRLPDWQLAQHRRAVSIYELAHTFAQIALWFSLMFVVVRALGGFVFGFLYRLRKGREASSLFRDIFSLAAYIVIVAVIVKSTFPSLSLGALVSGSALVGIILGLALQDTLGNLFAGISLHADNPYEVGDVITVGRWTGVVEGVTWRAVKIRTFSNHKLMLSNSHIAKEPIEVCPRDNANARIVFFNALYTDSPAKVIQVVRQAIREVENVRRQPAPVIRIRELGVSSVDYEVKYWLENYAMHNDTDALIRQRIWYAYRRANLNFAYPTQTLHIERPHVKETPAARGETLAERLAAISIFAPLTAEELSRLARASQSHVYAPGEMIIRAGDEGDSMFVLHRGHVAVQIEDEGEMRTVATLGEGDFFGEMALFTGEPRSAYVVASEETEVLEIGHAALGHLFESNPDLVESLGITVAERRAHLTASAEDDDTEKASAGLVASIKRFFRLD